METKLTMPVDLAAEVPDEAFLEGLRAVWHAPDIADALDPSMGVVAVTDIRGVVVRDEHARTLAGARRWLAECVDWPKVIGEEHRNAMGDE